MRRARTFVALAFGLAMLGCHGSSSSGLDAGPVDAGPTCASADDCADGQICDATTAKCGPCKSSGQCKTHQLCQAPSKNQPLQCVFASGYGDDCVKNGDCPAGDLCHQGLCLPSSEVTSCPTLECPSGQRCNRTNLVCELASGCFTDADCDTTQTCNTTTNQCDQKCTDDTADQVCAAGQKCFSGRCAQCAADADCQGGLTCNTGAGTCTNGHTCFTDRDCDVPLVCNPATSQCTQNPPPCVSDEQCKDGEVCDLPSGSCVTSGCVADRYEPNNHDQAHAAAIGPGPDIRVDDLTLCGGEYDYFSFAMLQGDLVQVVVNGDVLASQTYDTALLDPAGRVIATGDLAVNGQADSDGTFAVRVHSTDLSQSYGLRVTIDHTASSCQNDGLEPNDTAAQATRAQPPGFSTLAVCAGDHDWFFVEVPAGLGLDVSETADVGGGDLDLYAYAADGTTLLASSATSNATESIALGPAEVGGARVYLLVQGGDPRSENQYGLSVAYRADEPDAGPPPPFDAGSPVDAGADLDAGVDAGADLDAGSPVDAGADLDAGVDAGPDLDAGSDLDAGDAQDAGDADAGADLDGGDDGGGP